MPLTSLGHDRSAGTPASAPGRRHGGRRREHAAASAAGGGGRLRERARVDRPAPPTPCSYAPASHGWPLGLRARSRAGRSATMHGVTRSSAALSAGIVSTSVSPPWFDERRRQPGLPCSRRLVDAVRPHVDRSSTFRSRWRTRRCRPRSQSSAAVRPDDRRVAGRRLRVPEPEPAGRCCARSSPRTGRPGCRACRRSRSRLAARVVDGERRVDDRPRRGVGVPTL